ncbi:MAG: hypothetical protein ACK4L8_10805 [Nitrincola lacisaponensis]|uniref:hypothetical protein n=1 Tax=Nitrincola lacisaponensis TaxID=267850 RepID=UPI00391C8067
MIHYYHIINVPATRAAGCLMYWASGKPDTPEPQEAMIVNEDQVNRSLERYDNGATTRAVLTSTVTLNRPAEMQNILNSIIGNQEDAA